MPTVDVYNLNNEKVGTLELAEEVFGQQTREDLIWEVVKSQMARMRRGTASCKTRGQVSGTGAKPFRQKRTGRARQGTKRAPNHAGGGVAFGPHPRMYNVQVSKKVKRKALCSALSTQARENKLKVVRDFELPEIKTKRLAEIVKRFGLNKALLVDAKENVNLKMSSRNLANCAFRPVEGINLVDLLRFESLLISETSLKKLEGDLKP